MRFAHLSDPHPEWKTVAEDHMKNEEKLSYLYDLPIEEFRKIPYRPPPLSVNVPQPGQHLQISERQIRVRDGTKISLRIYRPMMTTGNHVLFFNIHGGGWTVGMPQTEEGQNRLIAARNEAIVVSVNYRLAPEFPFPYALEDSIDALKWTQSNARLLEADPSRIILGGGSAGANVAAVMAQIARDENMSGIIGQILNIPVTCHPDHFPHSKYEGNSYEQNALAPIVNAAKMHFFWNNYLPSGEAHPWNSPLLSKSLRGLPPTLVQVAGMDPVRDEGIAYAEALMAEGVDVKLKVYAGMPHAFYVYPDFGSSLEYLETMVEWVHQVSQTTQSTQ
ncbi:lipase esterase family protein [Aaosphaeria arxii CBS 175.79]|uniref:Lipase esterase family protein n=1 Tax=Aaosphaeria arxii CBS 175.79 TaxID=1450172 RepID=A0A6A5Y3F1_9PLEO|nr:lipase esterase family protein [Aaosphaeria arxii CBS 175.79]KAF2020075.1 lipase esterase family protein [Aaosphaeria arxii CBS 175.79]